MVFAYRNSFGNGQKSGDLVETFNVELSIYELSILSSDFSKTEN